MSTNEKVIEAPVKFGTHYATLRNNNAFIVIDAWIESTGQIKATSDIVVCKKTEAADGSIGSAYFKDSTRLIFRIKDLPAQSLMKTVTAAEKLLIKVQVRSPDANKYTVSVRTKPARDGANTITTTTGTLTVTSSNELFFTWDS